ACRELLRRIARALRLHRAGALRELDGAAPVARAAAVRRDEERESEAARADLLVARARVELARFREIDDALAALAQRTRVDARFVDPELAGLLEARDRPVEVAGRALQRAELRAAGGVLGGERLAVELARALLLAIAEARASGAVAGIARALEIGPPLRAVAIERREEHARGGERERAAL